MVPESSSEPVVTTFLSEKNFLVLDACAGARSRVVASLVALGAKRQSILATGSFGEAEGCLESLKPQVVLSDFKFGHRSGLELLQRQKTALADSSPSLFVLVTNNTSQAAVARAAEEDVDTYILKPFNQALFSTTFTAAVMKKLEPGEYLRTLEEGKRELDGAQPERAIAIFETAVGMSIQPTLAYFYLGQAELMNDSLPAALKNYDQGLTHSRIHYKCLIGLFELLTRQKKFPESYEVLQKVAQYFPANPTRMAAMLRLAVMTQNFGDVETYYRMFNQLDERSDELVNFMCSALVVTGKHYLQAHSRSRAAEFFSKAVSSAGPRTRFIRYAIEAYCHHGLVEEAEQYLKKFPATLQDTEDYLVADYVVMAKDAQSSNVLRRGRDLIKRGVSAYAIYRVMIEHASKEGHREMAEDLLGFALKTWCYPQHSRVKFSASKPRYRKTLPRGEG